MKTTNIISTPDITGNIGSCSTQSVEAPVSIGLVRDTYQVVMTNSCTGAVVKDYQYTQYGGGALFVLCVLSVFATVALISWLVD